MPVEAIFKMGQTFVQRKGREHVFSLYKKSKEKEERLLAFPGSR